jgi:hypothetical protein
LLPIFRPRSNTAPDIAICENDATKQFGAILTYSQDGSIKLLRTAESNDSIDAVRALVDRLQKDTATLFSEFSIPFALLYHYRHHTSAKYSAGSQIRGQQGFANKENGKFELSHAPSPRDNRIEGPDDDTAGLTSG